MRLTVAIKLKPTPEQEHTLEQTLERCNEACSWLARTGFEAKVFRQFDLHRAAYRELRDRFGLSAQVAVRCIAKVADAFKVNRSTAPTFRRYAAQPYDNRILRFAAGDRVSIWTLSGRVIMPVVAGERQRAMLASRSGECDLILSRGKWFLACVCDVEAAERIDPDAWLGVDLGIVTLAADSDGTNYTGAEVEKVRQRLAKRRAGLQSCGSKAAKRRLRKLSGRQSRFQRHTNHCISKAIVTEAQRTGRGIALEDLKGIRERVTARRSQQARLQNWAFAQLRNFIAYKAEIAGVPVVLVDPRHTSQTCGECGTVDARNRDKSNFHCVSCGHAAPADTNAAQNIRARATVARPESSRAA